MCGEEAGIKAYNSVTEIHPALQYQGISPSVLSSSFFVSSGFLRCYSLGILPPAQSVAVIRCRVETLGSRTGDRVGRVEKEREEELEDGEGGASIKSWKALQPVPFETSVEIWEFEGEGNSV